jgi:hypothetical protein
MSPLCFTLCSTLCCLLLVLLLWSHHRQGIARAMLAACDDAAAAVGSPAIWLHVRIADAGAQALYLGYDYAEVDREGPPPGTGGLLAAALRRAAPGGGRPRILMRRWLNCAGSEGGGDGDGGGG